MGVGDVTRPGGNGALRLRLTLLLYSASLPSMRGLDLRFKTGEVEVRDDVGLLLCLGRPLELALVSRGGSSGRRKIGEALAWHAAPSSIACKTVGVRVRPLNGSALASPHILALTSLPRRRSEMCFKSAEVTGPVFGLAPAPPPSGLTPLPRRLSEKRCRKVDACLPD